MNIHYKNIYFKFFLLLMISFVIGLPFNDYFKFITLLFSLPIIIFSKILKNVKIYFSLLILFIFFLYKFFNPGLIIQEGHNIVILNKFSSSYYEKNLPKEIFNFFQKKYNYYYINSNCNENINRCWKNYRPQNEESIFALSSDWSINKIKYSRITRDINVSNLTSAKIGIVNNNYLNLFQFEYEKKDLERDNLPFFMMYEIPELLVDSSLCWKGHIFWEENDNEFSYINNLDFECKLISEKDINKKIYAISLGLNENLFLKLEKNNFLKFNEYTNKSLILFTLIILFVLNLKFNSRIYFFSILYLTSFIILLFYINKDLFYGFDIFPGGMDGLVHMSHGNKIYQDLLKYNFYEAFKGSESVFYFLPGLRYFWSLSKFIFGDSLYGYLLMPYLYSGILFYILKYVVGIKWSLTIVFINFFTNAFDGYALPNMKMINQINVGHAEPLAIFFMLVSFLIFLKIIHNKINLNSKFYNFMFGFFLFLSVSLRPDYLPSSIILLLALIYYNYYNKTSFSSLFAILGFILLTLIPFHNYYFGNVYVLFTSNHPMIYSPENSHNNGIPLRIYFSVIFDLFQFNYNQNIDNIIIHLKKWIKPNQIHYILSIAVILFLLIIKNKYFVKILCLMALSQHFILLLFMPDQRYAYLAWILTMIINFYFIKKFIIKKIFKTYR